MEKSVLEKRSSIKNTSNQQTKNIIEVSKGHFVEIVEVYGEKPMDEVLEELSRFFSQIL